MATKRTTKKTTSASPKAKPSTTKATPKRTSRSSSRSAASRSTSARTSSRSTKSTPVKSTAAVATPAEKQETKTSSTTAASTSSTSARQSKGMSKAYIALIAVIIVLGVLLYVFRGLFVAAVVNGQPISRLEVVRQTEKQAGKQTLDTLVRNALIEQKAKESGVTVSDKEIDDEVTKLKDNLSKQGQNLDQVLQAQGMTQDDLRKLIRLDKLVSKMVGKDVTVSDAEVNKYIEDNKDSLPQGQDEATLKKTVADQLKQQKTNDKVRTWLADLQKQAKITYFVQY